MDAPDAALQPETAPGSLRGRLTTLAIMVVTGAIIFAVAYVTNQPVTVTATLPDGTVTQITVTGTATGAPPTVGRTAPAFLARTVDGTLFRLADLKGQAVWLTFGASWCQPCRAENPDIVAAYARYKDQGLAIVQVYIGEDERTVLDYTSRVGITYTRVPDPTQGLAAQYRILGIPSHFFIGRDGVLREIRIGSLTPQLIDDTVNRLLR